jgi:PrtD family type I secretion system ABC transporter
VRSFLSGPTIFPLLDGPWTPVYVAVIFLLHDWLGWLAAGGALALAVVSISAMRQAETATRNAHVVSAMGMLANLLKRWNGKINEIQQSHNQLGSRNAGVVAFSKFLRLILQMAVLGTGAYLVIGAEITPGAMIAASILMGRALAPLDAAIGSWRTAVGAQSAWRRVNTELSHATEQGRAIPLPEPKGRLEVRDLTFAFEGSKDPVLRNVRFDLEPGEALAIIGPSGSGKTTLGRLLVGNFAPNFGHVRLDGVEIFRWNSGDRGQYVGYLPQDVELFGGTVYENIARFADGNPDDVFDAAREAGAHDMILRLPNGYETDIGDGGAALSGGQRQWIGLARALYGNPKLIVLDEPNANLDQNGEKAFLQMMRMLARADVTVVVIAHRPSILRHIDKIIVLRDGLVQAFGSRAEILPKIMAKPAARQMPVSTA